MLSLAYTAQRCQPKQPKTIATDVNQQKTKKALTIKDKKGKMIDLQIHKGLIKWQTHHKQEKESNKIDKLIYAI